MVYLKPYFVRHILPADLAGVVVPLHDFLSELGSEKPSLFLAVVLFQRGFIIDACQQGISGGEVGIVA